MINEARDATSCRVDDHILVKGHEVITLEQNNERKCVSNVKDPLCNAVICNAYFPFAQNSPHYFYTRFSYVGRILRP